MTFCKELQADNKRIFLAGIIEGLSSEAKKVREFITNLTPDCIGVAVPEEIILELKAEELENDYNNKIALGFEDEIYARKLAVYGEVRVPWLYLEELVKQSRALRIPLESVDMSNEEYLKAFIECITPFQWIRYNLRLKRLKNKKFKARTAEEFVYEWKKAVTKIKGYRNLELRRNCYIATKILSVLDTVKSRILVFVKRQNFELIERELIQLLSSHQHYT